MSETRNASSALVKFLRTFVPFANGKFSREKLSAITIGVLALLQGVGWLPVDLDQEQFLAVILTLYGFYMSSRREREG